MHDNLYRFRYLRSWLGFLQRNIVFTKAESFEMKLLWLTVYEMTSFDFSIHFLF